MKKESKPETVKVAVRVRPMNKKEIEENSKWCVEVDKEQNQVSVQSDKQEAKTFQFDYVYQMNTTQREVYDEVAFPIVDSIFQGYNGTIFAYGQTGCGKTFTMMGIVDDPILKGVIPNAFHHIFGYINAEGNSKRFLVRCSFVEIYNEEVRDLLGNPNAKLEVREDPKKGAYVKGLSYTPLKNTDEIAKCLDKGNNCRHVAATSMNDQSSRSHSLFTVYVEIEDGQDESNKKIKSGKLNLVDLAGSERVSKTNATGKTFDEGKKINLSLTALGSVIDALAANRKHIPYKDSKLTRLLSDSLGGNTKTVMFANVSPASFNYEETLGTLRYASRAKLIKNSPKINEDPKDAWWRQYEEQIQWLKAQLAGKVENEPQLIPREHIDNEERDNKEEHSIEKENSDKEKQELWEKIAEWEKGMINGGIKDNVDSEALENNQAEKEEFKRYRLKQLEKEVSLENKIREWEKEKRQEEENLMNDANKLKQRIKHLKSEIEDWKYDNEKDRADFFENIKGSYRDVQWYRGIIRFLLSDNEWRRIIDLSRYNEETEVWNIHPFTLVQKELHWPNIPRNELQIFLDNEYEKRDMRLNRDNINNIMNINETKKKIKIKKVNVLNENHHNEKDDNNIPKHNITPILKVQIDNNDTNKEYKSKKEEDIDRTDNENNNNSFDLSSPNNIDDSKSNNLLKQTAKSTNLNHKLWIKKEKEKMENLMIYKNNNNQIITELVANIKSNDPSSDKIQNKKRNLEPLNRNNMFSFSGRNPILQINSVTNQLTKTNAWGMENNKGGNNTIKKIKWRKKQENNDNESY